MDRRKLRHRGTGYVHVVKSCHHHVARHGEPEFCKRVDQLRRAVESGIDEEVRRTLKRVVPTYHSPEEVNALAEQSEEMRMQKEPAPV